MLRRITCAFILLMILAAPFQTVYGAGESEEPMDIDILTLVNATHTLDQDYAPARLMDIAKLARSSKAEMLLRPEAAQAYLNMMAAMEADKVPVPYAVSGYRTYAYQLGLYDKKVASYTAKGMSLEDARAKAATSVAPPGMSEHQTGLAVDVSEDGSLSSAFAETKAGKWLNENSWKYGFVLRYHTDKSEITGIIFEPWHFRYVGEEHARIMYENGWCLEEYTEFLAEDAD